MASTIPKPGEQGHDWWTNIDQATAQRACFVDIGDIPPDAWAEAGRRLRDQSGRPFDDPCPPSAWPAIRAAILTASVYQHEIASTTPLT